MTALEEIKKALEALRHPKSMSMYTTQNDMISDLMKDRRLAVEALESLQRENEELRQDRDRTARNRDMWKDQVERQADSLSKFREEETRLRETLFKCGSFIADRYQEGDAEYQVVLLVNDAICSKPALASTGGEHHAE